MKLLLFTRFTLPFCLAALLFACNQEKPEREMPATKPEVFVPAAPEINSDSVPMIPEDSTDLTSPAAPEPAPEKLPAKEELETITPNQEARRALTSDAMKAAEMPLTEFGNYMKSRIPYYRGKGELKFENDIVRIHITKTEMLIQTPKGSLTFQMQ